MGKALRDCIAALAGLVVHGLQNTGRTHQPGPDAVPFSLGSQTRPRVFVQLASPVAPVGLAFHADLARSQLSKLK